MTARRCLAALSLTIPLLMAGCAAGDDAGTPPVATSNETPAAQTTDPDAPGFTNVLGGIGETVSTDGITITVNHVTESTEVEVQDNPLPSSPITVQQAQPGRKIVAVSTTIENTSDHPWDLTCTMAVQVSLADEQGRIHVPTNDTHLIPGNPECNNMLNPGLTADMTWRFEMAEGATPTAFGFANPEVNLNFPYYVDLRA